MVNYSISVYYKVYVVEFFPILGVSFSYYDEALKNRVYG